MSYHQTSPAVSPASRHLPRRAPALQEHSFRVSVLYDDGCYIAICNEIPITTESDTYEGVIERAKLIAPEIAELNGFLGKIKLVFQPDPRV